MCFVPCSFPSRQRSPLFPFTAGRSQIQFPPALKPPRFLFRLPDPVERLARDAVLSQKEAQLGRMFLHVAQGVQLELEKAHWLPPPPGESHLAVRLLV